MNGEANRDIRMLIKQSDIRYWQIAAMLGVCEMTLTRWMREELKPDVRERIIKFCKHKQKNLLEDEHPCNICRNRDQCFEVGCVLNRTYNEVYQCEVFGCFLNYEGDCKIKIFDDCGCRKAYDEEKGKKNDEDRKA